MKGAGPDSPHVRLPRINGLKGRRVLLALAAGMLLWSGPAQGQQPSETQQPNQQRRQSQPSPFEPVPEEKKDEKPAAPTAGAPAAAAPEAQAGPSNIVESIEIRGNRRIPRDSLVSRLSTKKGDPYDPEQLRHDFMILWNTGFFDDLRLEVEPGTIGQIVRFVVQERRIIRTIKYEGNKSVSVSDILDRFKERKVGLAVESRYDPTKVAYAATVIKEIEAERGRQFAIVTPEIHQIPPSSIELVFNVVEGPKVKVGKIQVVGNDDILSERAAIAAMKELRPYGIPHSIIFENLLAKTYDSTKLDVDKDRLRNAFQEKGYFRATVGEQTLTMRDVGGTGFRIPLLKPNKPGKVVDLRIPVEPGRQYHLGKVNFVNVKLFRTPDQVLRTLFQMQDGAIFDVSKLRKGMENMKKLYGEFGFIDFVAEPDFQFPEGSNQIDLTLDVDEGKQFFIRRINFSGNTTTRDKVIRRELYLDEGDIFNTRLWNLSILRLNQLGYFEPLKEEDAADIQRDTRDGLVDLTLKVKEKGKNTIGLNGGVSGFSGSFVGFNYSTNNFLGLGETLSLSTQLGTLQTAATFGFTEPYLFDKPIQTGFTVYVSRFNYNQAQQASILAGQNLIPYFNSLGAQNLQNFSQSSIGFTTFASYPLKRSFTRLGLTYGWDDSHVSTYSQASQIYFQYLDFRNVSGPNSLSGIITAKVTPNLLYNTVDNPLTPTRGRYLYVATEVASNFFGGNVNSIRPVIEAKYFRPVNHRRNVIGFHLLGSFLTGYGGQDPPPFARFYIGGENDIRGFDILTVSPIAFVPDTVTAQVYNDNGTPRTQNMIVNGALTQTPVSVTVPIYRIIFPGGDTEIVANAEYRIPIFGPVTLAPFFDIGVNRVSQLSQLTLNSGLISQLSGEFPQTAFSKNIQVVPQTEMWRSSTGLEIQVLMPVVHAPFRFYYAYNPLRVNTVLQAPLPADRSLFPNLVTYQNALAAYGRPFPFTEPHGTFRFTIGRTF